MKKARIDMILNTVQRHNILPITSKCNTSCVFCSHKYNPKDVCVYKLPSLNINEIEDMISFLDPNKKIIIGESATRIIEGEPFVRKDIYEILKKIRSYSKEVIEITTNGSNLTLDMVKKLKTLEPLELNVSLNSSKEENRKHLQRDKFPEVSLEGIKLLNSNNIKYHGSIVAMPMEVGYEDIYNTIKFLSENNSETIRIFVPGFSKLRDIDFDFYNVRYKLNNMINDIKKDIETPVLLEPPIINELKPVVEGVIKNTPSYLKIKKGDIITRVDKIKPLTRVDAFNIIKRKENPLVKVKRDNKYIDVKLFKKENEDSGIVMLYDISSTIIDDVGKIIRRNNSKNPVIFTSELGENILKMLFKEEIDIFSVKNNYFKGTIKSAGLLVISDFIKAFKEYKGDCDLLIIPSKPFDYNGVDLLGESLYDFEKKINLKVETI